MKGVEGKVKQGCRHPPLYDMMQWSENILTSSTGFSDLPAWNHIQKLTAGWQTLSQSGNRIVTGLGKVRVVDVDTQNSR